MTKQQKINALIKNGIRPEDVEQAYREGFEEAWAEATPGVLRTCYAAVALALHRELGYGRKRCVRILGAVDDIISETLTSQEAVDKVLEEIGLVLHLHEGLDRIEEKNDG